MTICDPVAFALTERLGVNPKGPRLLEVRLSPLSEQDKELIVADLHAANLAARRHGRRNQIVSAARETVASAKNFKSEAILIGDTNYPFGESGLLKAVEKTGLVYVDPKRKVSTYNRGPLKRGQFDRAWTTPGLEHEIFSVLPPTEPPNDSDHNRILVRVRCRTRQGYRKVA